MKTLKTVLIGFVAALGFFVGNATFTAHAAGLGFTVETPMPKNQIKGTDAYYNLLLAPDAKQTVNAKLVNKTKEPIKVKISAQTAITNSNGVIDYASNQKNTEKSLQYSLQDTVKVPAEVTIPASGSIKVPITMHMPAGKLKGVMAGGIFFRQVNADTEQSSENSVAIVNQYAFTTALLMRQSKKIYQPNLALQSVNAS